MTGWDYFDEYDVVAQGLVSHHYRVEDGRSRTASVRSATCGPPSST
jgi:hypothetical protein